MIDLRSRLFEGPISLVYEVQAKVMSVVVSCINVGFYPKGPWVRTKRSVCRAFSVCGGAQPDAWLRQQQFLEVFFVWWSNPPGLHRLWPWPLQGQPSKDEALKLRDMSGKGWICGEALCRLQFCSWNLRFWSSTSSPCSLPFHLKWCRCALGVLICSLILPGEQWRDCFESLKRLWALDFPTLSRQTTVEAFEVGFGIFCILMCL